MTYAEKLKSPKWQKKRLQILEQKKWQCEVCLEESKTLHVHHKYYSKSKMPWEYEDWAYSVLCKECHEIEQEAMEISHIVLASNPGLMLLIQEATEYTSIQAVSDVINSSVSIISRISQNAFSSGYETKKREL